MRPLPSLLAFACLVAGPARPGRADDDVPPGPGPSRAQSPWPGVNVRPSSPEEDAAVGRKLQELLREHGADVHGCWASALDAEPRLSGELLLRMVVGRGGVVERAEVLKDQVGSRRLADCLASAIRKWQAPALAGADVLFPLVFKPDATPSAPKPPAAAPAPSNARYVIPLAEGKPGRLGTGRVEARVLVDGQTVSAPQASLTHLLLHPSARLALHTHPSLELLYVVKGMARLRTGAGQLTTANAGDVIVAPAGVPHNIEAAPLAPLTLIQIFTPAGPEHAYRDPRDRTGTVPIAKGPASRIVVGAEGLPALVVNNASAKSYPLPGGKGEVTLLLDGLDLGTASLQRYEAQAGAEVPEHAHDRADEILYVLGGRAEMRVGARILTVGAGDAIYIPMGTAHALKVQDRLIAVQCYAPAGPEQRFKPRAP